MRKMKYPVSLLLCVCLLLFSRTGAQAAPPEEEPRTPDVTISTASELLDFAEHCRLDSYSEGSLVHLMDDIDLGGVDFTPIPIFSGTFDGNGHSITGLSITGKGSVQGLFRYLTDTAVVCDLTLLGNIAPTGSRSTIGGIAGHNAGQIKNCRVSLTLSGGNQVGGLAGINAVGGIIEACHTEGNIHGNHFVGGMAGENYGVIRTCTNSAQINITAQQNSIELTDITLDTLMGAEAANAVTDIGGIAGSNSGVIRDCDNRGTIGYKHMGYNIGGIAGSQKGYMVDCENDAPIYGRKEVGGIVGQVEPTTKIQYRRDTLQILQSQMSGLSSLANRASEHAKMNGSVVLDQLSTMGEQAGIAGEALGQLLPQDLKKPELPDDDTLLAAQNALSSSISSMNSTLENIAANSLDTADALANDVQAMADQLSAIGSTMQNASANLGGSFTDVSDSDTSDDTIGKVERCINRGCVLADRNAGGIAGAVALENDLDPEDDISISGTSSLNFSGELRAVILNCENQADVNAKKRNAGGIVGRLSLGLVKQSLNTGSVLSESADYVGGIAGQSAGYIRSCSAKCEIAGSAYVGGIAGSGTIVSDCRSMVLLTSGTEKLGAVLGAAEQGYTKVETPVEKNFYLSPAEDPGGIDGISYSGCAQPLSQTEFLALEDLPQAFQTVTIRFIFEDNTHQVMSIPLGGDLESAQIPVLPEHDGMKGTWEGLDETSTSDLTFDKTFRAVYSNRYTTIQSTQLRQNQRPILLAQGEFPSEQEIDLTKHTDSPALSQGQTFVEGWKFTLPSEGTVEALRYALPAQYEEEQIQLMLCDSSGIWREADAVLDGSHLVFEAQEEDTAFCLLHTAPNYVVLLLAACGVIILLQFLLLLTMRLKIRREKKETAPLS